MSDLVERLRLNGEDPSVAYYAGDLLDLAADRIEELEARVEYLESKINEPSWANFIENVSGGGS